MFEGFKVIAVREITIVSIPNGVDGFSWMGWDDSGKVSPTFPTQDQAKAWFNEN